MLNVFECSFSKIHNLIKALNYNWEMYIYKYEMYEKWIYEMRVLSFNFNSTLKAMNLLQ